MTDHDRDVTLEAADELEAIYRQQHGDGFGAIHPALVHKFNRDMDLVRRLRGIEPRWMPEPSVIITRPTDNFMESQVPRRSIWNQVLAWLANYG